MMRSKLPLLAIASTILLSACTGGQGPAASGQSTTVRVSPATVSLAAGDALNFAASVTGTIDTSVTWSVAEAAGGTIDGSGSYVAPQAVGTYHVVATSVADKTSSATAVVTVTSGAAQVNVSPAEATVTPSSAIQLSVSVDASSAGQPVTWSVEEGAAGGTISSDGLYVAPATPGTYNVVAEVSDPSAVATTSSSTALTTTVWRRGRSRIKVAPPPAQLAVSVSPSQASITAGTSLSLVATVANTTNESVGWAVEEGAAGGSVTSAGVYTAPAGAGTYHVVATSVADGTATATATISVTLPPPPSATISVTVNPSSTSLTAGGSASFAAAVTNSANQAVTWAVQEGAAGGTITAAGVYTAPSTVGTYHVVARSQADTTKIATATIAVAAPAPAITVSVNPSAATVTTGGAAAFTATVANSANQGVTWSVREGAAGGTVTGSGTYTAPATAGTYHVVATSQADNTRTATATVTVTAPPVAVTVAPSSASVSTGATLTFSATVSNSSNKAVTWSVQEGATGGSVTSAGLYTAPSAAGTYHVVATSSADPSKSASGAVTVTASSPPPPPPSSGSSCAAEPLRTTGTTYYVCSCDAGAAAGCVAGNDSNSGTSPSAPWKTIGKARAQFTSMNGGDTVALCRGGAWGGVAAPGNWGGNSRCSASSTCDLRDYASAWGGGKPTIALASGADLFSVSSAHGLRFFNVAVTGGEWPFVTWDNVSDLDACNMTLTGNNIGFYVATSSANTVRIALRQSTITNATSQGYLGACTDCAVDSNYFASNGAAGNARDHNIYVGQNPNGGVYYLNQGMRVTNNELHHSAGTPCASVQLVVHGSQGSLLIENNLISEAPGTDTNGSCYGISVGSGLDVVAHFPNLVIRRNRVFNSGSHGIDFAEAPNALIEDNVVVMDGAYGWEGQGILVGEASTPAGSDVLTSATVRNNTVYYASGTTGGNAISLGTEGTNHVVTGNVVVSRSTQTQNVFRCYSNDLAAGAYALLDRNACWFTAGSAGTGAGSNLVGNTSPPASIFVSAGNDPATSDFTPAAGSALIGAANTSACTVAGTAGQPCTSRVAVGAKLWSAADAGKNRVDNPTDIGAFEH